MTTYYNNVAGSFSGETKGPLLEEPMRPLEEEPRGPLEEEPRGPLEEEPREPLQDDPLFDGMTFAFQGTNAKKVLLGKNKAVHVVLNILMVATCIGIIEIIMLIKEHFHRTLIWYEDENLDLNSWIKHMIVVAGWLNKCEKEAKNKPSCSKTQEKVSSARAAWRYYDDFLSVFEQNHEEMYETVKKLGQLLGEVIHVEGQALLLYPSQESNIYIECAFTVLGDFPTIKFGSCVFVPVGKCFVIAQLSKVLPGNQRTYREMENAWISRPETHNVVMNYFTEVPRFYDNQEKTFTQIVQCITACGCAKNGIKEVYIPIQTMSGGFYKDNIPNLKTYAYLLEECGISPKFML